MQLKLTASVRKKQQQAAAETSPFGPSRLAFCRQRHVSVREVPITQLRLSRTVLEAIALLRYKRQENLARFHGICLDDMSKRFLVTEYCERGSLQSVLADRALKLNWSFKMSLLGDVARGLEALHADALVGSHGRLSSTCCLVTQRFQVKVADYGIAFLLEHKSPTNIGGQEVCG